MAFRIDLFVQYFLDYVRKNFNNNSNENIEQIGQSLAGTLVCMLGMLEENNNIPSTAFNTLGAKSMEQILKKSGYELSENYNNLSTVKPFND